MAEEMRVETVWTGADLVTMRDGKYHLIPQGALVVRAGRHQVSMTIHQPRGHDAARQMMMLIGDERGHLRLRPDPHQPARPHHQRALGDKMVLRHSVNGGGMRQRWQKRCA